MAPIFWVGTKIVFIAGLLRSFGSERSPNAAKTLLTSDRLNLPDESAKRVQRHSARGFLATSSNQRLTSHRTPRRDDSRMTPRRALAFWLGMIAAQPLAFVAKKATSHVFGTCLVWA